MLEGKIKILARGGDGDAVDAVDIVVSGAGDHFQAACAVTVELVEVVDAVLAPAIAWVEVVAQWGDVIAN